MAPILTRAVPALAAVCLVLAIGITQPISASGYTIELDLTWTGSGYLVEMRVEDPDGSPQWVGYDIQRTTFIECRSEIVLNEEALPRQNGQVTTYALEDADIADNTLYGYEILFVDSDRQPLGICDLFDCESNPFIGRYGRNCAQQGVAALVEGFVSELSYPIWVQPCPGTCGLEVFVTEQFDLLEPHVGSDYAVYLYGNVNCQDCGPEGCVTAELTDVVPIDCTVEQQPTSWGTLKSRYR